MAINLTYLSTVKTWLGVTEGDDDVLLSRLISQMSIAVVNYLQRPSLFLRPYVELQSGVGNRRLMLRNWPVVSVQSLLITSGGGSYGTSGLPSPQSIPPAQSFGSQGYTLSTWDGTDAGNPQELTLNGYVYPRGQNNVQISYMAGYCVRGEAQSVPASANVSGKYLVDTDDTFGSWAQDDGVTYADGVPLVNVPLGTTPTRGQYTVSNDGFGTYAFSAADAGQAVLVNYSFIPGALEQATVEWIGERYRYKDRIGQRTKSLGGTETSGYALGTPEHVKTALDAYKKWLPL